MNGLVEGGREKERAVGKDKRERDNGKQIT